MMRYVLLGVAVIIAACALSIRAGLAATPAPPRGGWPGPNSAPNAVYGKRLASNHAKIAICFLWVYRGVTVERCTWSASKRNLAMIWAASDGVSWKRRHR